VAIGTQNGMTLEEGGGMSAAFEDFNTVLRGLRNIDVQPSDTQDRNQRKKQCSITSAGSTKLKMEEFWEDQGQCFAFRNLGGYQSYMKLNDTKSVGYSNEIIN
jgi:hypothetical protein